MDGRLGTSQTTSDRNSLKSEGVFLVTCSIPVMAGDRASIDARSVTCCPRLTAIDQVVPAAKMIETGKTASREVLHINVQNPALPILRHCSTMNLKLRHLGLMAGQVYLIGYQSGENWMVKIGIAADPAQRLRQLQTGSPTKLCLLKSIAAAIPRRIESQLHRKYRHYRQTGEWFLMGEPAVKDLLATVERLDPEGASARG